MIYTEEDLIPLSALQHYAFCPRQCALIHIERLWDENLLTAEGRIMHERVHAKNHETRGEVRIVFGLPLRSMRLGLIGKADVVEFHLFEGTRWQPFPVEYKRGKPKPEHCDLIQLCAQGLCLEEMLSIPVSHGAIFYGRTRRRLEVSFNEDLRQETENIAKEVHSLIAAGITPAPVYEKHCASCSLIEKCMPKAFTRKLSVQHYLKRAIEEP